MALEVAKETTTKLGQFQTKLEEIGTTLTKLATKSEGNESLLKDLIRQFQGAEGQESVLTRLKMLEQENDNRSDDIDSVKKKLDEREKEGRARNWQLWIIIIGGFFTFVLSAVAFFLGIKK